MTSEACAGIDSNVGAAAVVVAANSPASGSSTESPAPEMSAAAGTMQAKQYKAAAPTSVPAAGAQPV